jgi:peptidoglycan/LPS O-acetylase OafA/YrhL
VTQQKVQFANTLRGIAAVIVVLSHYLGLFWFARPDVSALTGLPLLPDHIATPAATYVFILPQPIHLGPLGVSIFFLISGFVIPFSFEHQSRLQFALARTLRIWPTYTVGFLASVLVLYLADRHFGTSPPFSFGTALSHSVLGLRQLLGEPAIDPVVWTLEVEIKFYALAFLIGPLLRRASMACFAVPAILWLLAFNHVLPHWLDQALPYLVFMFVGTAFNFWFRGKLAAIPAAAVVAALMIGAGSIVPPKELPWWSINYASGFAIFVASMLGSRFFQASRITTFLADISYPLYVVHSFIGYAVMTILIQSFAMDGTLAFIAALLAAIVVAWIVHRLVEMPTQRLGKTSASSLQQLKDRPGLRPAVR